jgi:hypothetical protein
MRDAATTLLIIDDRGEKNLPPGNVYRRLYNPDLYPRASGRPSRNEGATTRGTTEETAGGMPRREIGEIIEFLRYERFKWSPVRRAPIPKGSGKTRPPGIPTWTDEALQEVMRSIPGAYHGPRFSPHAHGFRPRGGCHSALEISHTRTGTRWFVEGDIKGCFDNIDHTVLLSIIREKIHDSRFPVGIRPVKAVLDARAASAPAGPRPVPAVSRRPAPAAPTSGRSRAAGRPPGGSPARPGAGGPPRPSVTPSAGGRGGRPPSRAWALPARTRSRWTAPSNPAKTAAIPAGARPVGAVRPRASVGDTKPSFRSVGSPSATTGSAGDRPRRSGRRTPTASSSRRRAALRGDSRPGRSFAPEPTSWTRLTPSRSRSLRGAVIAATGVPQVCRSCAETRASSAARVGRPPPAPNPRSPAGAGPLVSPHPRRPVRGWP